MKKIFVIVFIGFLIVLPISAQKSSKSDFSQEKSAKLKDIRKLMEITGSGNLGMQVLNNMIESYRKMLPNVPDSFWTGFLQEVDANSLVDLIIPIYDRHLTHDEIKDIINFYESPSGRKLIKVLPEITNESMEAGSRWGKEIGAKIIERLQRRKQIIKIQVINNEEIL
ncbi:MAG: DUF2059 domain-containing protein [Deltaproteobacteria bacterium]|nr:DUF2059 domain-containing protein [Deltaproteobacteria bacterium]